MMFYIIFCIVVLSLSMISTVRLSLLSKAIRAEIQKTSDKRQEIIANDGKWEQVCSIAYPNIDQSYKNLKWYKPWERPSTLVAFDKE